MMSPDSNAETLILSLENCAVLMDKAADSRDYDSFFQTYRTGTKVFNQIGQLLARCGVEVLRPVKQQVEKVIADWRAVLEKVPAWQEEIKEEVRALKKRRANAAKIGKYFNNGRQKSAVNLYIKVQ